MKVTVITGKQGSVKNLKLAELLFEKDYVLVHAEGLQFKENYLDLKVNGDNILVIDEVKQEDQLNIVQKLVKDGGISLRRPYNENAQLHKVTELYILSQDDMYEQLPKDLEITHIKL